MRKLIFMLLLGLITVSCQKEMSISDELIGEWTYSNKVLANKPEVQMTFNLGPDYGLMTFECDGNGKWDSNSIFSDNDKHSQMNWQLDSDEQNITLTKSKHPLDPTIITSGDYMVTRIDRFNYILVMEHIFDNDPDLIVTNEIRLKRSN